MLKLLIYGYANGVVSSRKLETATHRDVAVRMLCADQHPDYRSIARFRVRHLDALSQLFVQALRLCARARLVGLGTLALDGTKLRANASRHKAMSYERMVSAEAQLESEIDALRENVGALLATPRCLVPAPPIGGVSAGGLFLRPSPRLLCDGVPALQGRRAGSARSIGSRLVVAASGLTPGRRYSRTRTPPAHPNAPWTARRCLQAVSNT